MNVCNACMFVCMHVMYVCDVMYVMYACARLCICACMYACMHFMRVVLACDECKCMCVMYVVCAVYVFNVMYDNVMHVCVNVL